MDEEVAVKPEKITYKQKLRYATAISEPMANKGTCKQILKLLKTAIQTNRDNVRVGLKDVQRAIRREETGFVVFAGDVTPIDILVHMPAVCEEKGIPYCFIPWRVDVGHALGLNRAIIAVLVKRNAEYEKLFDTVLGEFNQSPLY